MLATDQEEKLRQKTYQNELEKQRQKRKIELEKQLQAEQLESEAAFSELKRMLESKKLQIESVIFERLVDDKFALITSKDLDLKITSNMTPQSKAYQIVSDFYDKIAKETGLIRIKTYPNSWKSKHYLTGKQLNEYKSTKLNAVFGTNKDYQEARKRMLKDIAFMIFYPWLFAPVFPLMFSLMVIFLKPGRGGWNAPMFLLINFLLLLVLPVVGCIAALRTLFVDDSNI